jgi:hypothetical protein
MVHAGSSGSRGCYSTKRIGVPPPSFSAAAAPVRRLAAHARPAPGPPRRVRRTGATRGGGVIAAVRVRRVLAMTWKARIAALSGVATFYTRRR